MHASARHLLPVVEPRRRPKHRPGGGGRDTRAASTAPPSVQRPTFEPSAPSRALAVVALATIRRARRSADRPVRWHDPAFTRDVELIRAHLRPIRHRQVLAASFGREAFHGDPSGRADVMSAVAVAYAIRWLELGDGVDRPHWAAWLAESGQPAIDASDLLATAICD